ncbi:hypothetical protein VQ042_06840 [Aurantimonas sp. A2-1-M11]|uniref:hypothetical protein n=1 Tax=Aurantimonas sp. A2-1-M11 TaxID=3113712 RepID=UPI002F95E47E
MHRTFAALIAAVLILPVLPAAAQQTVGVRLSEREKAQSRRVVLSDGRVVLRPVSPGIPWLYGFGSRYGRASAQPLVNGVTPSVMADTPSGGIVPGQNPH